MFLQLRGFAYANVSFFACNFFSTGLGKGWFSTVSSVTAQHNVHGQLSCSLKFTSFMYPRNPTPWEKPWSRRSEWESVQRSQGAKPKVFNQKPDHSRSGYKSRQRRKLSRENYREAFNIPEVYREREPESRCCEDSFQ